MIQNFFFTEVHLPCILSCKWAANCGLNANGGSAEVQPHYSRKEPDDALLWYLRFVQVALKIHSEELLNENQKSYGLQTLSQLLVTDPGLSQYYKALKVHCVKFGLIK